MKNKLDPKQFSENFIDLIDRQWALLTAGNDKKINMMTVSWGGIGNVWNKPVAFVFVRPERYTYEFIENNEFFTLSFFTDEYRDALTLCGTKSGRTIDKISQSGLSPFLTLEHGTPAFNEARIVIECRKLYSDMMKEDSFVDFEDQKKWYGTRGGLHRLYIAEIVNIWIEDVL